ncbi:MAG TPA: patatin-like phospholipase family protein [Solirubrobacteraceae bacterium]
MTPSSVSSNGGGPPRGRVAMVLPGGGARGAYEIGALSVLLPALAARGERVDIWCGTSVGAINATAMAARAHLPPGEQVGHAEELWRALRKDDVMSPIAGIGGVRTAARLIGHGLRVPGLRFASLLDSSPLAASLDRWIDWSQLARNVGDGTLHAVCVIATSLGSGDPVGFVAQRGRPPAREQIALPG